MGERQGVLRAGWRPLDWRVFSPSSPTDYALRLLLLLVAALLVVRVVFAVLHTPLDPYLHLSTEAAITALVGALVYVVHRNGTLK